MANLLVTRFPNGVTNVAENDLFCDLASPDPTQFHTYFNDFDTYAAGDWTVTETSSTATQALADGDGGWLLVTNSDQDDSLCALQKVGESFLMESGKKAFFKTRFKVSDATQSDLVMGLQVTDTTPLDVTDGIYFQKADGSTSVNLICRKNATTGSNAESAVATLADDTFITLGWYYDGQGTVTYAVNGTVTGSMDASSSYLPDTDLTVSFAIQNGEAAAKTMTVDFVYAAKQR
jgi:hypothetical protein